MGDHVSTFDFLTTEESQEHFANCDFALKSGRHIQNHHHELKLFDYIKVYESELSYYYLKLFGVPLKHGEYHDQLYYYLDLEGDNKGKFTGSRNDRLSSRHILFGLLLLKIHRLDNYFGRDELSLKQLKDKLKNESSNYREDIYRLFARVANKSGASETDDSNIDIWIENSLSKFAELGWIYFDPNDEDQFTVLPSFNRLFALYFNEIKNLDQIIDPEKELTKT